MDRYHLGRKLLICCIAFLLACGCASPPESGVPSETSSEPSPASAPSASAAPDEEQKAPSWEDYVLLDMAKEPVIPWSEENITLSLSYALAWEPGREGYVRLDDILNGDERWGDAKIGGCGADYYLLRGEDGSVTPQCLNSGYSFSSEAPVSGILQADSRGLLFFPYKSMDLPFLRLERRDEELEKVLLEHTVLACSDGTALEIWPAAVGFEEDEQAVLLELLGIDGPEGLSAPRWYDVELHFSSVGAGSWPKDYFKSNVYGYLEDVRDHPEVVCTRYTGSCIDGMIPTSAAEQMRENDPLIVGGELSLSDLIWTGYAPWVYPDQQPGQDYTPEWPASDGGELIDLMGEPAAPWSSERFLLGLSYAYGWDLEREGYVRLDDGEPDGKWGSAQDLEVYSVYYLYSAYTGSQKLGISNCAYRFSPRDPIPGVLQVDHWSMRFYPYKSVEEPFLRVEPKDRDREKQLREETVLTCVDGTELEIKPLSVSFPRDADKGTLLALLGIGDPGESEPPRWFDVEIQFSSVEVDGRSDNIWEIFDTRVLGIPAENDPLTVHGELSLMEQVWL